MSRYINADNAIERLGAYLMADAQIEYGGMASEDIDDWKELAEDILKGTPSIDLEADYVPREFHDKTCEAMAKRHQDEIASMPDIVRCSKCENLKIYNTKELYAECRKWHIRFYPFMEDTRTHGCSWGERSE